MIQNLFWVKTKKQAVALDFLGVLCELIVVGDHCERCLTIPVCPELVTE